MPDTFHWTNITQKRCPFCQPDGQTECESWKQGLAQFSKMNEYMNGIRFVMEAIRKHPFAMFHTPYSTLPLNDKQFCIQICLIEKFKEISILLRNDSLIASIFTSLVRLEQIVRILVWFPHLIFMPVAF